MAPFPVFDTEYVDYTKNLLKEKMEKEQKENIDYDSLPVVACAGCGNIATEVDEHGNDVCYKCGEINNIKVYNNIHEYIEENDLDEDLYE